MAAIAALSIIAGEKVLTSTDFSFPNTLPEKKIKVSKVWDGVAHTIKTKYDSPGIGVNDIEKMRMNEEMFLSKKYGAVKGKLREELKNLKDDDSVDVVITSVPQVNNYLDKTKHTFEECKAQSIAFAKMKPTQTVRSIIEKAGIKVINAKTEYDASIILKIKRGDIEKLRFNLSIGAISKYIKSELCTTAAPLSSAATSAYNPGPMPTGAKGGGVKAATFETGIWNNWPRYEYNPTQYVDHFSARGNLVADNIYINNNNTLSEHSQITFSVLWYTAPEATFYHREDNFPGWSYNDPNAQNIINDGLQTISCSKEFYCDANYISMLLMDDFAYRYPYPCFCNPATNFRDGGSGIPANYIVNWQCYNALSVGSFQHENLNHYVWAGHSIWQNPEPFISGSPSDREMPYVLATGQWPYLVTDQPYDPDCKEGDGSFAAVGWGYEAALKSPFCHGSQGTSLAAPVANGIAACVISSNWTEFAVWPEKTRLAIMLTAQNCDSVEWNSNIDGKDGAGAISGQNAVAFAQTCTAISGPDNTAVQDGLYASSWYSTETAPKQFNILVPNPKPANMHLRVVVTWDSRPDLSAGLNHLSDLDLSVSDQANYYGASTSWNGNVEIVDVPRSTLSAGSTIQAVVTPWAFRFPPNTDYFYYSIGWTWVADHAL